MGRRRRPGLVHRSVVRKDGQRGVREGRAVAMVKGGG
jgi:hypothetical protein